MDPRQPRRWSPLFLLLGITVPLLLLFAAVYVFSLLMRGFD